MLASLRRPSHALRDLSFIATPIFSMEWKDQWREEMAIQQSSEVTAPSTVPRATSSWAELPTDVLSLIVPYISFRAVLRLSLVNRRLRHLVVEPASKASTHSSVWRRYRRSHLRCMSAWRKGQ